MSPSTPRTDGRRTYLSHEENQEERVIETLPRSEAVTLVRRLLFAAIPVCRGASRRRVLRRVVGRRPGCIRRALSSVPIRHGRSRMSQTSRGRSSKSVSRTVAQAAFRIRPGKLKRLVGVVRVVKGSWYAGGRRRTEQRTRARGQDRETRLARGGSPGADGQRIVTNVSRQRPRRRHCEHSRRDIIPLSSIPKEATTVRGPCHARSGSSQPLRSAKDNITLVAGASNDC